MPFVHPPLVSSHVSDPHSFIRLSSRFTSPTLIRSPDSRLVSLLRPLTTAHDFPTFSPRSLCFLPPVSLFLVSLSLTSVAFPMSTQSPPDTHDSNDVKESPSYDLLEEENLELRSRLGAMEAMLQRLIHPLADSVPVDPPVPRTPLSRPTTAYVPTPATPRPTPSSKKSLSFREPPAAPVAPTGTTPSSEVGEVHSSSPSSKPRSRKGLGTPEKFKGTTQERAHAEVWLNFTDDWLRLTAEGETDEVLVMSFGQVLDGTAKTWFHNLRTRAKREGTRLTLQDVYDAFVRTYVGGVSQKTAEQKLNSLVYGKGECKDLTATENEFDRLAQELYPGAEDSPAAISLLARIYSETIRRGDEELWEKAMDAQPSTIDEWKAAAQNAYVIIETKKAHHRGSRAERQEVRTTFYSRSSPSTSTSTSVQVKKVEHEEVSPRENEEDDSEDKAALQKAEVRSTLRSNARPPRERLGSHLTFKQRTRLSELGKCWICLEKGHISFDCEHKGKPGYPRTPAEKDLKA